MDKFIVEFSDLYKNQVKDGVLVFLLDILEDLKFVDPKLIQDNFQTIEKTINEKNMNITINLNLKSFKKVKENLQKIFLAILNFHIHEEKPEPPISEYLFKSHFNNIK